MTRAIDSREGNQLLAALPSDERQRLQPLLEWVALPAGASLYSAGAPLRHIFPTTAVISLVSTMRDGATVEAAMVGREGVAGVCAFMGSREALCTGVVLTAGHAWRVGALAAAEFARSSEALMRPVLHFCRRCSRRLRRSRRAIAIMAWQDNVLPLVAAQRRSRGEQRAERRQERIAGCSACVAKASLSAPAGCRAPG